MHDEWGISDGYFDVAGEWHSTSVETRDRLRAAMGEPQPGPPTWFVRSGEEHRLWNRCALKLENGDVVGDLDALPGDLPLGYHDLVPLDDGPTTRLIVHPGACQPIPHAWGVSAQLYALWSTSSWGIGDLGDLHALAQRCAAQGAEFVLTSPLHQPAPGIPQEASPYYPSSRRTWNPLLLRIEVPPQQKLVCSADRLIDRDAAWTAKRAQLEAQFAVVERNGSITHTRSGGHLECTLRSIRVRSGNRGHQSCGGPTRLRWIALLASDAAVGAGRGISWLVPSANWRTVAPCREQRCRTDWRPCCGFLSPGRRRVAVPRRARARCAHRCTSRSLQRRWARMGYSAICAVALAQCLL